MILKIDQVSKSFVPNAKILDNINFEINQGEVLVLCGASGTGKTTLVRIIAGLLDFDTGELSLGDQVKVQAGKKYHEELFGKIGVVFQQHNLFPHLTAKNNVSLALKLAKKKPGSEADEISMSFLKRVGLEDKADRFPATLSGGERQRVSIARALAIEPYLLLLDEPTAHLDPLLVDEVLSLIDDLSSSGTTMLLITHNLRFAKHVGKNFALLEDSRLTVSETPEILQGLEGKWS